MNPVRRFFRRYVFSTIMLLGLLLVANIALLAGLFVISEVKTTPREGFSITAFCEHLDQTPAGWQADAEAALMLDERGAWAMMLDPAGTVVWEYQMPDTLPRSYTAGAVAMFSRSYLEGWPVTVWAQDDGSLAVVGQPRGSMVKYYLAMDSSYLDFLSLLACGIFYANLLLVVVLFLHSARRVEKAMGPILNGIHSLTEGRPIHLKEDGELAEISASLNRAAAYISRKDNTRAEWIRGISHDIRTPLSVILGYASQLEEDDALPQATRDQAAVIRRQSEKLTGLVADLNLSTKLEYALRPLEKKQLDAAELARQTVSELLNGGLPGRYCIAFAEAEPGRPLPLTDRFADQNQAGILCRVFGTDPGGGVRGGIVDQNDFKIFPCLPAQRLQRFRQKLFRVENRHNDADFLLFTHSETPSGTPDEASCPHTDPPLPPVLRTSSGRGPKLRKFSFLPHGTQPAMSGIRFSSFLPDPAPDVSASD